MRIGCDHSVSSTPNARSRTASAASDNGFADTLASAVESGDSPAPEFSAATYRLFAAIELERGDTKHAELHLARVPDAREAGIPLEPTGLLSDLGRWDYTEAAAALPQTGKFDSATGQGVRSFIPYNARPDATPPADCTDETTTASTTADTETVARLRTAAANLTDATRGGRTQTAALAALLDELG